MFTPVSHLCSDTELLCRCINLSRQVWVVISPLFYYTEPLKSFVWSLFSPKAFSRESFLLKSLVCRSLRKRLTGFVRENDGLSHPVGDQASQASLYLSQLLNTKCCSLRLTPNWCRTHWAGLGALTRSCRNLLQAVISRTPWCDSSWHSFCFQ